MSRIDGQHHLATAVAVLATGEHRDVGDPDATVSIPFADISEWKIRCSCEWASDGIDNQTSLESTDFGPLLSQWEMHLRPATVLARVRDLSDQLARLDAERDRLAGYAHAIGASWGAIARASRLNRDDAEQRWASRPRNGQYITGPDGATWPRICISAVEVGDRIPVDEDDGVQPPHHQWSRVCQVIHRDDGYIEVDFDDGDGMTIGDTELWTTPVHPHWM